MPLQEEPVHSPLATLILVGEAQLVSHERRCDRLTGWPDQGHQLADLWLAAGLPHESLQLTAVIGLDADHHTTFRLGAVEGQ